jgi:signal transduction histidine kinase
MTQDQFYYIFTLIFLTGVQLVLHSVRVRMTLGAFFGLAGIYSILLWQLLQTGWWVKFGSMNLNAGTTLFIPPILLGSLLTLAFDGLRVARSYMILVAASCIAAWLFSVFREQLARYVPLPYLIVLSSREHLSIIAGLMFAQLLGMAAYLMVGRWKYKTGLFVASLLSVEGWLGIYSILNFGLAMGWANFRNEALPYLMAAFPAAMAITVYGEIMAMNGLRMPMRSVSSLLAIWRVSESNLSEGGDEMINRDRVISELGLLNRASAVNSRLMDFHLAHAAYGIVITDGKGKVQRANDPAKNIFGSVTLEQQDFGTLFGKRFGRDIGFADIVKEGGGKRWKTSGDPGESRWYEVIVTPLREGDSAADTGYYFLVVDVTDAVHEESRKLVSKRIRDLNQTGQVLTHDFSNLLIGADAQLRRIRDRTADHESLDAINGLASALGHAREMLNQIGAGSQFGTPRLQMEKIGEIIQRAVGISRGAAEEAGIRLVFENGVPLYVDADSNQLTRVFTNLIRNAIRASSSGSAITITVARKGNGVEAIVADEGTGMTDTEKEQAFEPGYSTKGGGKGGLGLSISYLMIDAHGGHLDLVNNPSGKGIHAVIWLPESRGREVVSGVTGKRVIVASAHPEKTRWLIAELEEKNECHVAEAYNENEIAALIADEERWDMIFMDKEMDMDKIQSMSNLPDIRLIQ